MKSIKDKIFDIFSMNKSAGESVDSDKEETEKIPEKNGEYYELAGQNESPEAESDSETGYEEDVDWESRVLCSDGNCIGVIGPDGRCRECGKRFEENPDRTSSMEEPKEEAEEEKKEPKEEAEEEKKEPKEEAGKEKEEEPWEDSEDAFIEKILEDETKTSSDDIFSETEAMEDTEKSENQTGPDSEWEHRKLCSDGNCIGVIGPDGLCKECGKPFNEEQN